MIKLWCQLAKNNLLIVCLLQLMKLVEVEIVQIICRLEKKKHFLVLLL